MSEAETSRSGSVRTALAPSRSTRSGALDAVRLLGLAGIVAGHVWSGETARALIYTWHVPLFFFLTGYLWREQRKLSSEVRRRTQTILIPYAAWLVIVGVIYGVSSSPKISGLAAHMVLGGRYLTYPFNAFWFATGLFVAALAYRAIGPTTDSSRLRAGGLAAVAGTLAGPDLARLPESVGTGFVAIFFVAAGDLFRCYRHLITIPHALLLLGTAAGLVIAGATDHLDLKQGDLGTPVLGLACAVAIAVGIITVFERVVPAAGRRVAAGSATVARAGLVVVLSHGLFLFLVHARPGIEFVSAFGSATALGLVLLRTPLAPILTGQAARRRASTASTTRSN